MGREMIKRKGTGWDEMGGGGTGRDGCDGMERRRIARKATGRDDMGRAGQDETGGDGTGGDGTGWHRSQGQGRDVMRWGGATGREGMKRDGGMTNHDHGEALPPCGHRVNFLVRANVGTVSLLARMGSFPGILARGNTKISLK